MNASLKPNFILAGAPKCGTTSMYYYLRQHPEIFMPELKEPHYFGRGLRWNKNALLLSEKDYLYLYKDAGSALIRGDSSTFYVFSESSPEEIAEFCPGAKIMIMLRNPVDLLYSLHSQYVFSGDEDQDDFQKALEIEEDRKQGRNLPKNIDMQNKVFYKTNIRSLPGNISSFIRVFGRENVFILTLDELKSETDMIIREVYRFLGVDETFVPDISVKNPNKIPRSRTVRDWIKRNKAQLGRFRSMLIKKPLGIIRNVENANTLYTPREELDENLRRELMLELTPVVDEIEDITGLDLGDWKLTG